MGWWWRQNSPSDSDKVVPPAQASGAVSQPAAPAATLSNAPSIPHPDQPLTEEDEAEREMAEWIREIAAESRQCSKSFPPPPEPGAAAQPSREKMSESLYEREMSCRTAFDYAMFCQSFGGQFVNIYRYGTFRSCSNHWQDFWLCLRTRQWDRQEREEAIVDHNRKKHIKYKRGPSSEDVWTARTEPVEGAFQGDYEAIEQYLAEHGAQNAGEKACWER